MNIGQHGAAVRRAERPHHIFAADNVRRRRYREILEAAAADVVAQHLVEIRRTHAQALLDGAFDRHILVELQIEIL